MFSKQLSLHQTANFQAKFKKIFIITEQTANIAAQKQKVAKGILLMHYSPSGHFLGNKVQEQKKKINSKKKETKLRQPKGANF